MEKTAQERIVDIAEKSALSFRDQCAIAIRIAISRKMAWDKDELENCAALAFDLADAMEAERKKRNAK